ncbi:DUF4142 domain-containing protein [Myroides ceti]|uniref:DUF4142 domain-containing protein n=1 Tax=Paenimyroides ceti TaxID=395087 RepID=A0ABT8CWG8_9FLAO|nr:DUF4142 domain-containing protein [Paenimyroides ceti]MDN3707379.1 DUF4142 domain-containing protein [Paenimyroides ceti]
MKKLILIAALMLATTTVFAQKTVTQKAKTEQTGTEQDIQFVMKALEGGNAEIKKGSLARSKSKNPEIVKYAEMMENDHHSVNGKLKQVAQQKGYKVSDILSTEAQQMYNSLNKMDGDAFDREFVNQMIADHLQAIELFKEQVANGTDQELKDLASSALPVLEIHLKEIERLQNNMNRKKPN